MGTLRSTFDHTGMVVNGCLLGYPVELDGDPTTFEWDHYLIPNGEILEDGTIVPDEQDPEL